MLLLIFIYYFKGILSISDIQTVLKPITDRFFAGNEGLKLEMCIRDSPITDDSGKCFGMYAIPWRVENDKVRFFFDFIQYL